MAIKDKDIIESLKEGRNTQILEHLYEKVLPKISRYIRKNSGTEDDAFDIFQDGVIIFYKYLITGRYNSNNYQQLFEVNLEDGSQREITPQGVQRRFRAVGYNANESQSVFQNQHNDLQLFSDHLFH